MLLSDSDIGPICFANFGIPYNYFFVLGHKFFDSKQILVLQNILGGMYNYGVFRGFAVLRFRIVRSIGSIKIKRTKAC
ncbi:MAG: Uncharacterised protein [Gammaproteobacteria bacterium]|nr:MAG: Uncharacterised protein [Gammaproteobacteria bacterium]